MQGKYIDCKVGDVNMLLNNNVKNTLKYGAVICWGNFRFCRGVEFKSGKEIFRMWYVGDLVGEYEDFYDMVEDHYKMLDVKFNRTKEKSTKPLD